MDVRVGNPDERRQMKNGVGPFQRLADGFRIANIARNNSYVFCLGRQQIQEAGIVARIVPDERRDVRVQREQALHQVAADEAAGSGYHNISAGPMS